MPRLSGWNRRLFKDNTNWWDHCRFRLGLMAIKVITLAAILFALFCVLFPVALKVINEKDRPLICYKCWASKTHDEMMTDQANGGWDRPWCLSDQAESEQPHLVDTVICEPSETYCGIYYHEKKEVNGSGEVEAIFVRGCQEDVNRPSMFIGTWPTTLYGSSTGRQVLDEDPVTNTSHVYQIWDQACSTPLCNHWEDHRKSWGWIDWLKEAYSFRCPALPAQRRRKHRPAASPEFQ